MKKNNLDENGFNKNHSYDTNVEHYEFNHNNDGMFIDENGSVRYGKPPKKTKNKKAYNPSNNSPNKNLKITLITIGIILGVLRLIIIPVFSLVLDKINYLNSTNYYNNSYTSDTYTDDTYIDDSYDDTYLTEDNYVDYDFNNGYLCISGPNEHDTAAEISKVINYSSFNDFTLTYNNQENFDDYYLAKYNEAVQYCKDNNLDYLLPTDDSRHYINIYDVGNIDYFYVDYYNDETYDYSYFNIVLIQGSDKLALTEPIDKVFSDLTSSLGDNSQQICETFKRLSEYCSTNAEYLSDKSFYGSIYDDNYSIYYDYSGDELVLSLTIENPNYYDTSF